MDWNANVETLKSDLLFREMNNEGSALACAIGGDELIKIEREHAMTGTVYSPDIPKTAEEIELGDILRRLAYRLEDAREDSAEYKMILRQMEGIRHSSELGGLLMEEYDISGIRAAPYW